MAYETLALENHGAVRRILLARPAQRNAQSQQMLDELAAALDEAQGDTHVNVVVIGGQGEHFSAGHDLKQAQAERANFTVEERWAYEELRYFDYSLKIWDFPKPTIAQVQGACVAGGFMIANMCDLVVASESAYFSDPVGHTLGAAATEVLIHPWVMGARKAKELLFTGARLSAQEARRSAWSTAWWPMPTWPTPRWPWPSRSPRRHPSASSSSSAPSTARWTRRACARRWRRTSTPTSSRTCPKAFTARDRGLANAIQKNPEKNA
jgi:enoyl-CoA hydratase